MVSYLIILISWICSEPFWAESWTNQVGILLEFNFGNMTWLISAIALLHIWHAYKVVRGLQRSSTFLTQLLEIGIVGGLPHHSELWAQSMKGKSNGVQNGFPPKDLVVLARRLTSTLFLLSLQILAFQCVFVSSQILLLHNICRWRSCRLIPGLCIHVMQETSQHFN